MLNRIPRQRSLWPIRLGGFRSYLDMLELNAARFFDTILEVQRVKTVIDQAFDSDGKAANVEGARDNIRKNFEELTAATQFIGAEVASIAASRMAARLADPEQATTMADVSRAIEDVQSRLRDECQLVSFMILNRNQKMLFGDANSLVATWDINKLFPDAARELEEAAKCLALQRPTAGVFHAMRMLEVGIKKIGVLLETAEPTKPVEKNWAVVLKSIKDAIDKKYPAKSRMPESEGSAYERLYASLDAVKNPWRNGTMHVESFYSDSEALHILRCVTFFMQVLASLCEPDEVDPPTNDQGVFG